MEKEIESKNQRLGHWLSMKIEKNLLLYVACKHKMEAKFLEKRNMYAILR